MYESLEGHKDSSPQYHQFDDHNTLECRALQLYLILISCAHNRQTITYGMLADTIGYKGANVLGRQLGHIAFWCEDTELPPLTVLAVNQDGTPGEGFPTDGNLNKLRETVFNFEWFAIFPPTSEALRQSFQSR